MKDSSTRETREYVVKIIVWCLISMFIYKNILFSYLPNMTYEASLIILWIILFISIAVCSGCFFRKWRARWSIAVSLLYSYGFYTIVAYWRALQIRIKTIFLIAAILSLLTGVFVMIRRNNAEHEIYTVAKRLRSWFTATGCIFAVAMAVIMSPPLFWGVLGLTFFRQGIELGTGPAIEEQAISGTVDTGEADSEGNKIAGSSVKIYADDWPSGNTRCRYRDENGLFGYLAADGSALTPAIYVEASEMDCGKARVRGLSGAVYYLNSDGERISAYYTDGLEFENQGCFARVMLTDGKWGIINRNGDLILRGADYIQPLPIVVTNGSAVIEGHACLINTSITSDNVVVTYEFEDYCAISEVWDDHLVIVENEEGMKGVADICGNMIIPALYKSIIMYDISTDPLFGDIDIIFACVEEDGSKKIIRKMW